MTRSGPFVLAVFALIFGGVIAAGATVTLAFGEGPWYIRFTPVLGFAAYAFAVHVAFRAFKPLFTVVPDDH